MKKMIVLFISWILCVICVLPSGMVFAEEAEETDTETAVDAEAVQDHLVTTQHSTVIQGEVIDYTATAGTMVVESGGGKCEIFFVAYTRDGIDDLSSRPITFVYNGGPGSASIMTQLLFMGPKRMELGEDGHASSLPGRWVDNENSILDMTDLVFIDAVGTGYSRACSDEDLFLGYTNDIRTFGDFIRLYVTRMQRWGSPKYVAGESYGTTRSAGLYRYLADTYNLGLNGIMLVSSVNDFSSVVFSPGNDLVYAAFLPTYAADAWYHQRLEEQYQGMDLAAFLEEVRSFVSNTYIHALFEGRKLTKDEKEAIAVQMASYIGLDSELIKENNFRIPFDMFSEELLKDQNLIIGRLDGRYTGAPVSGSIDDGESDPSEFDLSLPLTSMANQYFSEELGFETDTPYISLSSDINARWSFDADNSYLAQEDIIYDALSKDSFLKIWVLCGYYDGATPFYGAEWVFNHVFLDDEKADKLTFTYYPSGHMFYLDQSSFDQFRKEAEDWFQ